MSKKYSPKAVREIEAAAKPRVLLNVCTHGTERVGLRVAKDIEKLTLLKGTLVVNVANERALELKKRYVSADLNRVFPGKQKGNHEEELAYAMTPFVRSFDIVVDIHSTETGLNSTLITTKMNTRLRELINTVGPKRVVVMKATKNNALISNAKLGIAFEYGRDGSRRTRIETTVGVKRLLGALGMIKVKTTTNNSVEFFTAYGTTPKPMGAVPNLKIRNFQYVPVGTVLGYEKGTLKPIFAKNSFYPVLYGKNSYKSIFGFEAQKEELVSATKLKKELKRS